MKPPADVIIAVTSRCNAHCQMCNIWKSDVADTIEPLHLEKLPAGVKTINLSGGEPFLRADLIDFVRSGRKACPKAVITISTNGYLPELIAERMREIRSVDPEIRLAVSIDGIGEVHDRVRGDDGAFDRAMKTIELVAADGFEGLRLSMTISEANADQLQGVFDLADRLGLELGIVAAHESQTHLQIDKPFGDISSDSLDADFALVIRRWLRGSNPKLWLRAHFTELTRRYLQGDRPIFACQAGRGFVFIQADGDVYSCSVLGKSMGNLIGDSWPDIWAGGCAGQARSFSARSFSARCDQGCWMICTARSFYRSRSASVVWWILRNKIRAHLVGRE